MKNRIGHWDFFLVHSGFERQNKLFLPFLTDVYLFQRLSVGFNEKAAIHSNTAICSIEETFSFYVEMFLPKRH